MFDEGVKADGASPMPDFKAEAEKALESRL